MPGLVAVIGNTRFSTAAGSSQDQQAAPGTNEVNQLAQAVGSRRFLSLENLIAGVLNPWTLALQSGQR